MSDCHKKEFMQTFRSISRHSNRYEIWRDFVMMAGISFQNSVLRDDDLEQKYLDIVKRYSKEDVHLFPKLLAHLTMGLEERKNDFLGACFMELEISSSQLGQFFTPYDLSLLMSKLTFSSSLLKLDDGKQPFITLSEPACGAGGMVIACAETMYSEGYNPQKQLWVECWDVDIVAAMMCYIQLSLLHIPARVVHGNTLTMERYGVYHTPAHYLGNWDYKTKRYWSGNPNRKQTAEVEKQAVELVTSKDVAAQKPAPLPQADVVMPAHDKNGQYSLFDF